MSSLNEAKINLYIKKSLVANCGLGFKIPDPPKTSVMTAIKNPVDGIGGFKNSQGIINPVYWESKFSKELKSFNPLSLLREHQALYLDLFSKINSAICLVPYGVKAGRGDLRAYLFLWEAIKPIYERQNPECISIPAKILKNLPYAKFDSKTETFCISEDLFITKEMLIPLLPEFPR